MPVAINCPSCGAPVSDTSVIALAPICTNCRSVITVLGGTLGLTGAYGVSDRTITRRRVEADLAVFREYQEKYRGMKEACIQQLDWGVERYAQLPQRPELLALEDVPPFWNVGLFEAAIWFVLSYTVAEILVWLYPLLHALFSTLLGLIGIGSAAVFDIILHRIVYVGCVVIVLVSLFPHFRARLANGDMPQENARRQKAYEEAVAAALKEAEPLKAAEDHRLRVRIRELESLAKTVGEEEAEVRLLLATL